MTKITYKGHEYDYAAAVNLMNDDLRETLHSLFVGVVSEQEFFDIYVKAHEKRFNEIFSIS